VDGKIVLTAQGEEETVEQILDVCQALEQEKLVFFLEFVANGKSIFWGNGENAAEITEERMGRGIYGKADCAMQLYIKCETNLWQHDKCA